MTTLIDALREEAARAEQARVLDLRDELRRRGEEQDRARFLADRKPRGRLFHRIRKDNAR